jgi:hypothetical protein
MLAEQYLRDELNKFAKYVIQQSRSNLSKGKKNVSKELYNSLGYEISQNGSSMSLGFNMVDYGKFQDRGVKGTKSNYIENKQSPYSYKSKGGKRGLKGMPPPKAFDKWIVRKGLKGIRDKKGRFLSRKTLQFLVAKSVFEKGIKASMFFTKPFAAAFKRLPDELVEAYAIGIEKQIQVNISK